MPRRHAVLACTLATALTAPALADYQLLNNGPYITATSGGFNNAPISQPATTPAVGFNTDEHTPAPNGPGRAADDFVISGAPARGVRLSRLEWLAFQTQTGTFTTSPVWQAAYAAIYDGNPSQGGQLIAGDFTTNRLISNTWTGVYRVSPGTSASTLQAQNRPIQRLNIDMSWAPPLHDGTYWLVVSFTPETTRTTFGFSFPVTPLPAVGNGLELFGGNWIATSEYPFTLFAKCPADFNGQNDIDLLDIFAFLNAWFAHDPSADFNGQNGVELLDIFAFLNAWFAGTC
jgi:hypothetical protein